MAITNDVLDTDMLNIVRRSVINMLQTVYQTLAIYCIFYIGDGIAQSDYELDDREFDSRRGLGIFLFTTASKTALGLTQPPIQWVPGALSLGVKRPVREADHSPPSSTEVNPPLPNMPLWCGA
jgi:hypothetical protein